MNKKFMLEISHIKDPELFLGVARLLKVNLFDDNKEPRDFTDLFADIMNAYAACSRKKRHSIYTILAKANMAKE